MNNITKSIKEVKNKTGRVDCLVFGIAERLLQVLDTKTNLPISQGVMPIVEHHIKKHVPKGTVIPKEYKEIAKILAERF